VRVFFLCGAFLGAWLVVVRVLCWCGACIGAGLVLKVGSRLD